MHHGPLACRVPVIELQSITPTCKARVTAKGEDAGAVRELNPNPVLGFLSDVLFCTGDQKLGMTEHPFVVRCNVIWDEVEHYFEAAPASTVSELSKRSLTTKRLIGFVGLHRKRRPDDIRSEEH